MTAPGVDDEHWHRAWVDALDALEADIDRVEAVLADDHRLRDHPIADPWNPPEGLGPLPLDLVPRADAIILRQARAARAITVALVANRRQAIAADRIEVGSQGASRPVYLDQAL